MRFQIGEMTVGDILDRGFKLLVGRFPTFFAINLIVQAPALLFSLVLMPVVFQRIEAGDINVMGLLLAGFGALVLMLIFALIGVGATMHVIAQDFIDRRVTVGEAIQVGFSRAGAIFVTWLLGGLLIIVGFIACCIPGLIILVWYAFLTQVVVLEGLSGPAAMTRSKELGTGYGWRIFGIIFLVGIISGVINYSGNLLEKALPWSELVPAAGGAVTFKFTSYTNYVIVTLISFLFQVVANTYYAVCVSLLYFDLRIRKEGFDLEVAARQNLLEEKTEEQW